MSHFKRELALVNTCASSCGNTGEADVIHRYLAQRVARLFLYTLLKNRFYFFQINLIKKLELNCK